MLTGLILAAGASLTACQDKAEGDSTGFGAPGADARRAEDKFGTKFGNAFRAPANAEPVVVEDGDLLPVSNTAEPEQVN